VKSKLSKLFDDVQSIVGKEYLTRIENYTEELGFYLHHFFAILGAQVDLVA
jgi:hypothetical protein